jgi:hypothetical protein
VNRYRSQPIHSQWTSFLGVNIHEDAAAGWYLLTGNYNARSIDAPEIP